LLLAGTGAVSPAADLKPLPLSQRMLRAGDLVGFTPDNPVYVSDPSKAAQRCPDHEADRLRKSGFVAAAGLHLGSGRSGRGAISYVTRFLGADSATAGRWRFLRTPTGRGPGPCGSVAFRRQPPGVPHGPQARLLQGPGDPRRSRNRSHALG